MKGHGKGVVDRKKVNKINESNGNCLLYPLCCCFGISISCGMFDIENGLRKLSFLGGFMSICDKKKDVSLSFYETGMVF